MAKYGAPFKMNGHTLPGPNQSPLHQEKKMTKTKTKLLKKGVHNEATYEYIEGMEDMSDEEIAKIMKRNLDANALTPGFQHGARADSVLTGNYILRGRDLKK